MFTREFKVYIDGTKDIFVVKSGTNLYKLLQEKGLINETLCKGQGQCGKCKVFIRSASGKDINKPTKRDKVILASVNLEAGYRLACQYNVKTDIFVKIEKNDLDVHDDILSIKFKNKQTEDTKQVVETSVDDLIKDIEKEPASKNIEDVNKTTHLEDKSTLEIKETITSHELTVDKPYNTDSNNVIKKEEPESFHELIDNVYNPTDGLILLQYENGIKYYIYSAGINSISSEGLINTDEKLLDIIVNNMISDFIYNHIHLTDIERLIIILDKKYYNGTALFNLINYYVFNVGSMLCEVIQPENTGLDIILFCRLLYNNKKRNVFISLESLSRIFYFEDTKLIEVLADHKLLREGFLQFLKQGNNPIMLINSNLEVILKDKYEIPDSINFAAILHLAKYLLKEGIMTEDFLLKDRNELIDIVPTDKLIKLSNIDGKKLFYIYRRKNTELYVNQDILDLFFIFRVYINLILKLVKAHLKKIDNIYLFTLEKYDNLVNEFVDLKIIPVEYSKRIVYSPGDPTILTTKFFQYRNIKEYLEEYVKEYNIIKIDETNTFKDFESFICKRGILS